MAYVTEEVKTIRTFGVTFSEEEMRIIVKILGNAPTSEKSYVRPNSYTIYMDLKEAIED